ncbi:MAG: lamin tail domain-containing protein [Akkermansiaceae bacterium]|nr:lamin tail domain-containing protein [Akkermansiaceae bacterium]
MKKLIFSLAALSLTLSASAQLVINELLYDPSPGNDVNQDGEANTSQDEFVEIVNTGNVSVNISGYQITDLSGNFFEFPAGSMISANEAIVVFGGGNPAATLNGVSVFVGAPSLNNSGDTITLQDSSFTQVDQVRYEDNSSDDESLNRSPELVGGFQPHTTIASSVGSESPGTDVTGASFGDPLPSIMLSPATSSIRESGAGSTTTLTVNLPEAPATYPLIVNLTSDDLTEATVPPTLSITSGLTATFLVTGVDDPDPDGAREVSISAVAEGFRGAVATVTVTDDGDVGTEAGSPLLITQYHEGFSNNKYVELTNVSDSEINLGNFILTRWSNASTEDFKTDGNFPSSQLALSGILPAGASFIVANPSATTPVLAGAADVTSDITFYNGNDSVVLYQGDTGETANIIDAISVTADGNEGNDTSVVRQNTLTGFNLDAGSTFRDFPVVWQEVSIGEVDSSALGTNNFIGSSVLGKNSPLVGFKATSVIVNEADGTADIEVEILNPDGAAVTVSIVLDDINSTVAPTDIGNFVSRTVAFPAGAQSGDTRVITVTLADDSEQETAETAIFLLSDLTSNGDARISGASAFNLNIQDNDTVIPPVYISEIADPGDNFEGRFVELFNPTNEDIDLGSGNWNILHYVNGSSNGRAIPLSGTIPAKGTFVIANNSVNFAASYPDAPLPDQESSTINSNGDDNIELRFGGDQSTGTLVDVYGKPGIDGTGEIWEFLDSRVDRAVGAPNATFTIEEWIITPAAVSDMTPSVHGGGGPPVVTGLEVLGFSVDPVIGQAELIVLGLGTKVWILQSSSNLGATDAWEEVPGGFAEIDNPDGSTTIRFSDTISSVPTRYYRLIEQP